MDRNGMIELLTRLVMAHSPSGHEDEIQPIIMEEFQRAATTCGWTRRAT